MNADAKTRIEEDMRNFSRQGLRCLAICYKEDLGEVADYTGKNHPAHRILENSDNFLRLETNPILIGIVGILDPPRPEVHTSIKSCNDAGIFVIMITGDIKETAETIAKNIGIIEKGASDLSERSFTGKQFFTTFSSKQQLTIMKHAIARRHGLVFSRTEPAHKRELVKILASLD